MSSEVKLAPCPFCGGEAYFEDDGVIQETLYWVNCKCGIGTTYCHSKEFLAKTWNTRQPSPALSVAVEALEWLANGSPKIYGFETITIARDALAKIKGEVGE